MKLKVLCYFRAVHRKANTKTSPSLKGTLRIMKLTAILLLAVSLQLSARVHSQNVTLSMKDVSLQKVFKEINKQTGLQFFYKDKLLNRAGKVNIDVANVPVQDALQLCFKNLAITYQVVNNAILIKEKPNTPPANGTEEALPPPPITVTGTVTSDKGEPVAGASITIKGSNKGTTTNDNGYFSLSGVDENAVLIISGTNIEKTEIKVAGRNTINLTAKIKIAVVDEVQIIAYGTTTKRLSTGTIATVKGEEIKDRPVTTVMDALQGKLAGVSIKSGGAGLGSPPTILIRGVNSITSSGNPLIIVDGVVVNEKTGSLTGGDPLGSINSVANPNGSSTLDFINPNDIETIDVLKDADATGIYGSRGTNGVILITTKKAKLGSSKLTANVSTGWKSPTVLTKRMNTPQYLQMRKDAFATGNMTSATSVINPITPTVTTAPDLLVYDQNAYTDFTKMEAQNTAPDYRADLSMSGGTKALNYIASASYYKLFDVYMFKPYQERMTGRLGLNHSSLNGRFNMGLGATFGLENQKFAYTNSWDYSGLHASSNAPNFSLYKSDGSLNLGGTSSQLGAYNPLVNETVSNKGQTKNVLLNSSLSYTIIKGLTAKLDASYTSQANATHLLYPSTAVNSQDITFNPTPSGTHTTNQFTSVNIEPQLSYTKNIAKATITALTGATFLDKKNDYTGVEVNNPGSDGLLSSYGAGQPTTAASNSTEEKFRSVFARVGGDWDKRYLLNLSFRRDGSSRFGPNNRYANFASAGAGWIFSSESFIKDKLHFLSYGKLRGSYGTTGNNNIADYQYLGLLTSPPSYSTGAFPGYAYQNPLAPSNYPNPNVKWETTTKKDIGLELGFFKNRVLLNSTWYRSATTDLLVTIPLASQSGFSSYVGNFPGVVQNTGWELELTTQNLAPGSKLKWTTKFNLTHNKNILKSFPNLAASVYNRYYEVGRALPGNLETPYHFTGIDPATGLPTFEDINKDGVINTNDTYTKAAYIGSSLPVLWGGLTNSLSYKGFSLDIFLQFTNGIFTKWNYGVVRLGQEYNPAADMVGNYWMKPGDVSKYPRLYTGAAGIAAYTDPLTSVYPYSTANLYKGYYIRLKNLQLSYSIPARILGRLKASNAQVFISGENLAVYTPVKLYKDPEISTFPLNSSGLLRTITTGIRLAF